MSSKLDRRDVLRLFGGFGLLALAPPAASACTSATATTDPLSCVARPTLTEGPYFVDEKLERADIRADPGGEARPGVPLELTFVVQRLTNGSCTPLAGVLVDVWHCDAEGSYSDVGAAKGKKYLRGYQRTGEGGTVTFVTIFPGWYQGRAVHVHFKLRGDAGAAFEHTAQLFFDEATQSEVYATSAYASRGEADTSNDSDDIYGDGGAAYLLTPSRAGEGYAAKIVIGLEV